MNATTHEEPEKGRIKKERPDKPVHILIVEDEPLPAEQIRRGLLAYATPYRVTVAPTIADAQRILGTDPPDLLLLDMYLPDGKGEDFFPDNPEGFRFPVIAMISAGDDATAPQLLQRGFIDYLIKSKLSFDDMPHLAENALRAWELQRSRRALMQKLNTQESLIRAMMENPADSMVLLDREGTILDLNRTFADRLNRPRPVALGTSIFGYFPEDLARSRKEHMQEVIRTGMVLRYEDSRDGRWYENILQPVQDPSGRVVQVVVIARDITDRKTADSDFKKSGEQYRFLVENIRDAVWATTPNLRFTYLNRAVEPLTGYAPAELLDRSVLEVLTPASADAVQTRVSQRRDVMRQGKTEVDAMFEVELVKKDGSIIQAEVNSNPVRDPEGTLIGFQGITRDITGRKQAEEALRESEERYRDLFDLSPVGILLTDPAGNILEANRSMLETFGYAREEIGPVNMAILYSDPDFRRHVVDTILARGSVSDFELTLKRRDGSTFPAILRSSQITRAGKQLFQSSVVDITDRKLMEEEIRSLNSVLEQRVHQRTDELNASLEEKVVLLREIHHRVKNNLQIIISLLRLQNRHTSDAGTQAVLLDSESRIRSMALVHEKLYRSVDLAHIDIGDYLRDLTRYLFNTYSISQHQIAFRVEIANLALDINRAIPIGLILNELITNALRHAFPGEKRGEVVIRSRQDGNDIIIEIQDNGIGMPDGFNWRHSPSLGMHLIMTLIEQVRGTIELEEGVSGTHFIIRIPGDAGKVVAT